jgi:ubiquitin-protein ligase
MTSVRIRRLMADYESVRRLVRLHGKIQVEGVSGNPPDRYVLTLRVRSLRERGGEIQTADVHRLEITLPSGYPRDPPFFRMLTPVFHPNIAPHAVCIADHWTAGQSLDALIQRVGEMLAFQSYNTKSPLNGLAAQWVEENVGRLPIETEEFVLDLEARATGRQEIL